MLGQGRGKWAVAQILILISSFYIMLTTTDLSPLPLKTTRSLLKRKQTNKQTKNVHVLLCKRFIQLLLLKILWQYITANHSMSKAQLTAPLIAYDIENRLLIVNSDDINGLEIERKDLLKKLKKINEYIWIYTKYCHSITKRSTKFNCELSLL